MTKHSPSTEPMNMIMNPKTGKMVQAGGQLGKKIIRDYNADKIYNPLTGKQVLTGGSVGKKVLGLYKEGGTNTNSRPPQNTNTFNCSDSSDNQQMNVYLLFRSMKRKHIETNTFENITPLNCSSKMTTNTYKLPLNTCKELGNFGNFGKREWMQHITDGLKKIFPEIFPKEQMQLNDTFWEELEKCYVKGENQYKIKLKDFLDQHTYTFKIVQPPLQQTPKSPQSPQSETYEFKVIDYEENPVAEGTVVIITDARQLSTHVKDLIGVYKRRNIGN